MEIKTSLKKLTALFAQAANDEALPIEMRSYAAKMIILSAHVQRIEAKIDKLAGVTDAQVAELASHVAMLKQGTAGAPPPAPVEGDEGEAGAKAPEDETAEEMAERVLRETEAEARSAQAAALAKGGNGATVTPLRQPEPEPAAPDEGGVA